MIPPTVHAAFSLFADAQTDLNSLVPSPETDLYALLQDDADSVASIHYAPISTSRPSISITNIGVDIWM